MIVLATFFMLILVSSFNLLTMFIGIVGFSICLYVLISFDCTEAAAREASAKYYYLSVFSSALLAFGIFLLYLLFGSLTLGDLSFFLTKYTMFSHVNLNVVTFDAEFGLVSVAFISILLGFLFKLAAFPCHF
jgi:NADH:ubiquinone oxidoreductase subunit 2 (subunit N)